MRHPIRLFLLLESISFVIAGLIHSGLFVAIDIHHQAAIAESTIGAVLLAGFALTWIWPTQTRLTGLIVQVFALLGTMVGVFTIIAGFGPRTVPDASFHAALLILLGWGLVVAARSANPQSVRA